MTLKEFLAVYYIFLRRDPKVVGRLPTSPIAFKVSVDEMIGYDHGSATMRATQFSIKQAGRLAGHLAFLQ